MEMKNLLRFFIALTLLNSCKDDNYAAPELTVTGKIIDSKTNALVESGGSNGGSIVKFYQNNSTQALLYKTMPDGTFINSRVFAGNYRYVAEGPFQVMLDTPSMAINANMQMEIKVVPNVRLTTTVTSKSANAAIIKIAYEKVPTNSTITKLGLVWSTVTAPNIFTFTGGNISTKNVQAMNLTSGNEEFTITGLKAGTKYYVRATAVTNAPGNYYNYSMQIEVQL